jgi:uncharacterized protein YfcZ (UPF0381/DUF406 family)
MPARSKSQRRLMRMAYAYKKGEFKGESSQEVKNLAKQMSLKDLKDFAKTKEDDLPQKSEIKSGEENNMTINEKEIKKIAKDIMSEGCEIKRKKKKVSEERSMPIKERFSLLSRSIFENNELLNIGQKVSDLTEKASDTILSESDGDWFDNHTLKRNASEITKKGHEFNKNAVELKKIFERMQALYEEIGMLIERYL